MEGCPRLHPATLQVYVYRFYEACKELMNLASKDSSSIPPWIHLLFWRAYIWTQQKYPGQVESIQQTLLQTLW